MTYGELLQALHELKPAQLEDEVTIWDTVQDEYLAAVGFHVQQGNDILSDQHPFLTI